MAKILVSRGRGPRIREEELDQMVALYLEGKSYKAIAQKVGRHWQTVRKYTIKSLQEREGRELRREALKGALADHYRDLVQTLTSLSEVLKGPAEAYGWQPDRRNRLLLQALRDYHAKESPLWSWWDDWNRAGQAYVNALSALRERMTREMEALGKSPTGVSNTLTEELGEVLFKRAESIAQKGHLYDPSLLKIHSSEEIQGGVNPQEIWLGNSTRLAQGKGMAGLKGRLTNTMEGIAEWEEVKNLAKLYRQMLDLQEKTAEEVEVLSLRRAFPGHCRLCPV